MPQTPHMYAFNRGKLISPPLGIYSLSSPNLWFAKGRDLLARDEWKCREVNTSFILLAQSLAIMTMPAALPFFLLLLYRRNLPSLAKYITPWCLQIAQPFHFIFLCNPYTSLFGYHAKSHTQTKWPTTKLIGSNIKTRQPWTAPPPHSGIWRRRGLW